MRKHSKRHGRERSGTALSARLIRARDRDDRITRELFDSVGQHLTALKMSVTALASSGNRDRSKLVNQTQGLIEAAIVEVLTASHRLHPPMLDEFGLEVSLRWYARGFTELNGIDMKLEIPSDMPRLSGHIEINLFRIVQECLTNLQRHSGSRRGWISIVITRTGLRLEVRDEGRGIAAQGPASRIGQTGLGVGIPVMRERVRFLGGNLTIRSSQKGTQVIATLPIISIN